MEYGSEVRSRRDILGAGLALGGFVLLNSCGREKLRSSSPQPTDSQLVQPSIVRPSPLLSPQRLPEVTPYLYVPDKVSSTVETFHDQLVHEISLHKRYLPVDHFIDTGPKQARNIAVTVDDFEVNDVNGLSPAEYLAEILQLGRQSDTSFTFFPTGRALDRFKSEGHARIWQQAVEDGHVIGNHTYHHYDLTTLPNSQVRYELADAHAALGRVLGYEYPKYLMRPPYGGGGYPGSQGSQQEDDHQRILQITEDEGYCMTMWDIDSNTPDNTAVITADEDNRYLKKIFGDRSARDPGEPLMNGTIILLHSQTLSAAATKVLVHRLKTHEAAHGSEPTHDAFHPMTVPDLFYPKPPSVQ
jgi:peptidoglycan/xylan/chitin deacetylase (PgdA/CDA1 family)